MLSQNRQAHSLLDVSGWVPLLAIISWPGLSPSISGCAVLTSLFWWLVSGMQCVPFSVPTSKVFPDSTRTHGLEQALAMLCVWGLSQMLPSSGVRRITSGHGEPSALCPAGAAWDSSVGLWSWLSVG